jgi:phosphoglycerate dehydrogenase-like enzyme
LKAGARMRALLHVGPFNLPDSAVDQLQNSCGEVESVTTCDATPLDELADTEFEILVAEEIPHNLARWPRLRFVQLVSAGINHLDGHPVWRSEIFVANASGTHSVPIAQYVTCAVLMLAHHMPRAIAPETTRHWRREKLECTIVRGQTVGIIGYGSIGRECARQLHALGMRVVCMKRDPANRRDEGFTAWPGTGDPIGELPDRWFSSQQLDEMLPSCDVIVVTTPATMETLGMIGIKEFALMKKTAVLVNVARGGIVDEQALAEAVRKQSLAGAVVDCFATEPIPPEHVYFDTPGIILTPHVAGVCDEFWPIMAKLLDENVRRFVAGSPVLNLVDVRRGY